MGWDSTQLSLAWVYQTTFLFGTYISKTFIWCWGNSTRSPTLRNDLMGTVSIQVLGISTKMKDFSHFPRASKNIALVIFHQPHPAVPFTAHPTAGPSWMNWIWQLFQTNLGHENFGMEIGEKNELAQFIWGFTRGFHEWINHQLSNSLNTSILGVQKPIAFELHPQKENCFLANLDSFLTKHYSLFHMIYVVGGFSTSQEY